MSENSRRDSLLAVIRKNMHRSCERSVVLEENDRRLGLSGIPSGLLPAVRVRQDVI